ncbi:hypothetical protein ACFWNR_06335 [Streptomyces virginiae]|uniref:hypothetical protein n=1 Tax=Streptomyces virginiae TaxID=1961 RepID=UPI00364E28FD
MAAARHHMKNPDMKQVRKQILDDISNSRKAYQNLVAAGNGNGRIAIDAKKAWDEYLDELALFDAGRWAPKHSRY